MKAKIFFYSVLLPLGLLALSLAPKLSNIQLSRPLISLETLKQGHKLVIEMGTGARTFVSQIRPRIA